MALGFHANEVNLNCEKERNVGEGEKERENRGYLTWMETESCLQQFQHPSDHLQLWFQRYDSSTSSQLSHLLHVRDCEVYSATLSFECCSKKAGRSVKKVIFLYVCVCVSHFVMETDIWKCRSWAKTGERNEWVCICDRAQVWYIWRWIHGRGYKIFILNKITYCTHIACGLCAQSFSKCMSSWYLNLCLFLLSDTKLSE